MITTETRHLTASMVVLDPEAASVLLVWHRATGKLMFPGGHVDPDEAPYEAACREVCEETGVGVGLMGFALYDLPPGFRQLPNPWMTVEIPAPPKPDRGPGKPAEPPHSHIDLLFIGEADSGLPLRPALAEVSKAGWYPVADLTNRGRYDCRAEVPELAAHALWLRGGDGRISRLYDADTQVSGQR